MSKKHSARKKRRRKSTKPPLCPSCHVRADGSPASLLGAVAALLNTCEQAGVKIRFRHGAAYSFHGVVLPPTKNGLWEARAFGVLPTSPAQDDSSDETGDD